MHLIKNCTKHFFTIAVNLIENKLINETCLVSFLSFFYNYNGIFFFRKLKKNKIKQENEHLVHCNTYS